jgi:hypothetical protein
LHNNGFDDASKQLLRDSLKDRPNLELKLFPDEEERAAALAKPICEREWRWLSQLERAQAEFLGFDAQGWDAYDDDGWQRTPQWGAMNAQQRQAASALQFDQDSWWGPPPYV